jgi:hypothetical protein
MPTPQARNIKSEQIVITTIHSDVMPKIFSSMGAKYGTKEKKENEKACNGENKSRHHHKFYRSYLHKLFQ